MNENESVLDEVYKNINDKLGLTEEDQSKFKSGKHIPDTGYMEFLKVEDNLTKEKYLDAIVGVIEEEYKEAGYSVERKKNVVFTEKIDDKEKSYKIDVIITQGLKEMTAQVYFMENMEKLLKEYIRNH